MELLCDPDGAIKICKMAAGILPCPQINAKSFQVRDSCTKCWDRRHIPADDWH